MILVIDFAYVLGFGLAVFASIIYVVVSAYFHNKKTKR